MKTSIGRRGYRAIRIPGHPMAAPNGWAAEHRVVLYDAIGDGPHACHWCGRSLNWKDEAADRLYADHVDGTRLNNVADNLVPACLACNLARGVGQADRLREGKPRKRLHWRAVVREHARRSTNEGSTEARA